MGVCGRDADAGADQQQRCGREANDHLWIRHFLSQKREEGRHRLRRLCPPAPFAYRCDVVLQTYPAEGAQLARVVDHNGHHGRVPVPQHVHAHFEQLPAHVVCVVVKLLYLQMAKQACV